MKVLKFGGTSVGTPERMRHVVELVTKEQRCLVVLSALARTTDTLLSYARVIADQQTDVAHGILQDLEAHYRRFIRGLYDSEGARTRAEQMVTRHMEFLESHAGDGEVPYDERTILAQGELMSTALLQFRLEELGRRSMLLPALEFMRLDEHGEPDMQALEATLLPVVASHADCPLFVTQGYICRNAFGETDNLKRGGSDYSASLIGAAIRAEEIQIWTDIDGMHNSDPRYVEGTQSIRELSFDEAAELAYFGAKILHPSSILPARKQNIPVRLLNTLDPSAPGTLITGKKTYGHIKAVAAKDGITAINIRSSRMLLAYGFLRRIFEVFELHRTPIDLITTSEVAVSVTIDDAGRLEEIVRDLGQYGTVEVDQQLSIICVVGDFVAEASGAALRVIESLKNIPVRMISYGGSPHNISLLIDSELKARALNALHQGLFHVHP